MSTANTAINKRTPSELRQCTQDIIRALGAQDSDEAISGFIAVEHKYSQAVHHEAYGRLLGLLVANCPMGAIEKAVHHEGLALRNLGRILAAIQSTNE